MAHGPDLDETVEDEPEAPDRAAARPSGGRDRYEVREEIARGGTGRVSRAHDRQLEREVAIKALLDPSVQHELRFAREARVTARLQHPSIVPIYDIGRLADGQPYYAMKLVSGRTLDEAIRSAGSLEQRLALFPALVGVADAIAYAHAQRVIHRDLKPQNVVLGPFGESLVIDWGLAKQLDATGITDDDGDHEPSADPSLTIEGAVLGTPAYMPPEQARGVAVDERADVYALGAILYHLLSGHPPYRGPHARAILVEVLEGAPPPLRSSIDGIPEDLLTIVDKAMARAPDDRYADAQQLVADLRRFQTGQLVGAHRYTAFEHLRRFVRRHAGAVAVAGVLGAALVVGSFVAVAQILERNEIADEQRKAAEAARSLALAQRDAAEDLAGFMLEDLRDRLEPIGRLELLRGVGARVQRYYATLAAAGIEQDAAAEHRRGQALALVGEAQLDAGDVPAAFATLVEVHTLAERIGDLPLAARAGERLGVIHRRRAELSRATDRLTAAIDAAESSGELVIEWRARLGLANVASDENDWIRARGEAEHALALVQSLQDLDGGTHLVDLAETLMTLAITTRVAGFTEATQLLRDARELMLDAIADEPYDTRMLMQLLRLDERIARFTPRATDARALTAEACELARRLRAIEPKNAGFVRAQLAALEIDAAVQGIAGDHVGALAGLREALAAAQLGARLEPENVDALRTVGYMRNRVGDALYGSGDYRGAAAVYRDALVDLESIDRDEQSAAHRVELLHCHYDLGSTLDDLGEDDAALGEYGEAVALGEALLVEGPNSEASNYLARTLVARALLLRADAVASRRDAARAIELIEPLPARSGGLEDALAEARSLLQ